MVDNPPHRVLEQARTHHLGAPIRAYDARSRAFGWVLILILAAVVLVVGGVAYRRAGQPVPAMIAIALAAAYLCGAAVIVWLSVVHGRVVHLFEHGLAVRSGRTPEAFTWDDLISVTVTGDQTTRRGAPRWRFTATCADGREIVLGADLPRLGELAEIVTNEVMVRVVPWYLRAVSAGGTVSFGPFTVSRDGVVKDGDLLPWQYVRDVRIDNGMVVVQRVRAETEAWGTPGSDIALAATVGSVPNAVALAALCREVRARMVDR
jgi:hypothetical protein